MKITRKNYEQFFLDYFEGNLPDNRVGELMRFLDENPDLRDEFDAFEMIRVDGDDGARFPDKDALMKSGPADVFAGNDELGGEHGQPGSGEFELHGSRGDRHDGRHGGRRQHDAVEKFVELRKSGPGSECISPLNYEEYFAAYVEGDLDKVERAEVEAFAASDPRYGRELEVMRQTRLVPDPAIRFPRKGSLKRHHIGFTAFTARRVLHYASAAAAVFLLGVVAFTLFPLQEPIHVAYDRPVEEEVALPEAVAEAPAPQREEAVASLREDAGVPVSGEEAAPDRATALPAELFRPATAPDRAFADDRAMEAQAETEVSRPMMATRMEPRQVDSHAGRVAIADASEGISQVAEGAPERLKTRAELTPREEYIWLAYREPGYIAMDDPDALRDREGALPRVAASRLQETAGVDFRRLEETLTESSSGLTQFADRTFAEINRFFSGLVTVNEQREDGRRVQLAIGDVFEVSRTAPGE